MYKTYLVHHGIKGQRWGVRRFQRKDGTLTAAGKRRTDDSSSSQNRSKMSTKKKVAIGLGIGIGSAAVATSAAIGIRHYNSAKMAKLRAEKIHKLRRVAKKAYDLNETTDRYYGQRAANNAARRLVEIAKAMEEQGYTVADLKWK